MTTQRFIEEIEGYYGPYERGATRKYVADYVSKTYSDRFLDRLFKRLLLEFTIQFKITPGITIIEGVKKKILQEPDYHKPFIALPAPRDKPSNAQHEEIARRAKELIDNLTVKKQLRKYTQLEEWE